MARGVFSLNRVYKKQFQNVNDGNFESWPEVETHGYFAGGDFSPTTSIIDRLDFSTETASDPGNVLSQARYNSAGLSNSRYGYFAGGFAPSVPGQINLIERLDFSTETTSPPGNNLPQARRNIAALSSSSYGYFAGGAPGRCTIDRLDFSTETTLAPGPELTKPFTSFAGVSN